MIGKNDKISSLQLAILLINTIIGVGVLSLPNTLAKNLKSDGWVLVIVSGILAIIFTIIVSKLMETYSGKTFVEFGKELVTTPVSFVVSIIFVVYFIGLSAFATRVLGEVVKMYLLLSTPIEVIIMTMLLTTTYAARCGVEVMARMSIIIIIAVSIPIAFLFVAVFMDIEINNLLPVFQFSIMDVIKGIPSVFFSFIGFEFLLIFMAYSANQKKSTKYNVFSIVIIMIIYIFNFMISLGQFGVDELTHQLWPTLSLSQTINIPGAFIENVEGIVMGIWVLIAFTSIAPALYGYSIILSTLFKHKEHKHFVLPLVPIIYIVSLIPDNLVMVYNYMDTFVNYVGTFSAVIVPLTYFIISRFKKNKKRGKASNG